MNDFIPAGRRAAISAMAFLAVAASAKPVGEPVSGDRAIIAVHVYAACVADRTPYGAEQVLAMDPNEASSHRMLERIAQGHPACEPGGRIPFNDALFRSGLAERLLAKRADSAGLVSRLAYDPTRRPVRAWDERDLVGLCMARKNPQAVAALLGTEPASAAEGQAEQALAPSFPACVKAGHTLQLGRATIRAMLAVAAWQIAAGTR
jgi:hypothetical protein